jgi:NTE family protein
MREQLEAKGKTRFGDLRTDEPPANGRAPYRLKVIASDLSLSRLLILPDDAALLGIEPDELEVAEAVRMSMSIPIFFAPVIRKNPKTGNEHVIVDGGLLSNFPVWLFDLPAGQPPRCPTFGLLLVAPSATAPLAIGPPEDTGRHRDLNMIEFLEAIAHTAMEAHDRLYLEQATFARTIPISTIGVGTTDFGIQRERADALFKSGVDAAATFLQTWDLAAYNAAFRSGLPQPTRRERVVEHMRRQAGGPPSP